MGSEKLPTFRMLSQAEAALRELVPRDPTAYESACIATLLAVVREHASLERELAELREAAERLCTKIETGSQWPTEEVHEACIALRDVLNRLPAASEPAKEPTP